MNNCIILKHFKTSSGVFTEERCFQDIIDFNYWITKSSTSCYVLNGFRLDEYTKGVIPVSYIIGFYENDYIYYNYKKYELKDFPKLAQEIYDRNIERSLKVLDG